jgi:hypothetical protein
MTSRTRSTHSGWPQARARFWYLSIPCFLTVRRTPCAIRFAFKTLPAEPTPRRDIIRSSPRPASNPYAPGAIPEPDRDEAGAKYLMACAKLTQRAGRPLITRGIGRPFHVMRRPNPMSVDYWCNLPRDIDPLRYAKDFVDYVLWPNSGIIATNRQVLWPRFEEPWFRPALELEVAGICCLAGPLGERDVAGSLPFFIVDHLIMGWNSILVSHPRVAYTLSRHVIKASIFAVATRVAFAEFRQLWDTNQATGGKILKLIRPLIPSQLASELDTAWRYVVSFGHVSAIPSTLAIVDGPFVEGSSIQGYSFGGPHMGALPNDALMHLGGTFTMIAESSLSAFSFTFSEALRRHEGWGSAHAAHSALIAHRIANEEPPDVQAPESRIDGA